MLANVLSAAIVGVDAHLVDASKSTFPPGCLVLHRPGFPMPPMRESRDRVPGGPQEQRVSFSRQKVTVNLAPPTSKEGAGLDLADCPVFWWLKTSFRLRP